MATSKETATRGREKPILLKGIGQTMCLEVKIGSLGLEVWHFPNEEAHPYARLILEPDQDGKADDQAEQGRAELSVTVDCSRPMLSLKLFRSGCHILNRISRIIAYPPSMLNSLPSRSISIGMVGDKDPG